MESTSRTYEKGRLERSSKRLIDEIKQQVRVKRSLNDVNIECKRSDCNNIIRIVFAICADARGLWARLINAVVDVGAASLALSDILDERRSLVILECVTSLPERTAITVTKWRFASNGVPSVRTKHIQEVQDVIYVES